MAVNRTNTLLDKLKSQASNLISNPNIQLNTFDSLQRNLQRYWKRTYGVNFLTLTTNIPSLGTSSPVTPTSSITGARFLVLSVQGAKNLDGTTNKRASGKNVIFIANYVYNMRPGTVMTLNTPRNRNVRVTVQGYIGLGAIAVNEILTTDVLDINSGGTDYESNYGAFPYVEYLGSMTR